jgi:hypothetical protein
MTKPAPGLRVASRFGGAFGGGLPSLVDVRELADGVEGGHRKTPTPFLLVEAGRASTC